VLTTTSYTFNTSYSGIAYLQTGDCGFNGEECGIVEMTLINPTVAGGGSSADISYIPPLAYSVPYSFSYYGGCDGQGASCSSADCSEAFYTSDETYVQVACEDDDVNLLITFCVTSSSSSDSSTSSSSSSSSSSVASVSASSTTAAATTSVVGQSQELVSTAEAASTVVSSTAAAASSTGRCTNRKRRVGLDNRSQGLRSHRRRSIPHHL